MKSRIIVAVIFTPLLFALLFFAPLAALMAFIALISAIGIYEILEPIKKRLGKISVVSSVITAAAVPVWVYFGQDRTEAVLWLIIFTTALFCSAMFTKKEKPGYLEISSAGFSALLIPFLLSSLLNISMMENGRYLVLLPFIAAFLSDAGAYFIGCSIGKHRLAPSVSPKKSVEGAIGGMVSAVVFMLVYGLILNKAAGMEVNYILFAAYGLLGSIAGQIGDLTFSYIKRRYGIKDFGNLLPGHGGILDRFDSIVFVAPITEVFLVWLPMIG